MRDLIHGIDYESRLYETSPSPKAAEMRMKNVNTLFSWMTEMLEGSELEEPMTLTQSCYPLYPTRHDGTWRE